MVTSVSDERRREEIVERTLMGLEEDIEDLREDLIDQLQSFEAHIGTLEKRLPRWLELPSGTIKAVFRFSSDTVEPSAMLGPRAVAMGAGRVESFVYEWLGEGGGTVDVAFDDTDVEALADAYEELEAYLDALADDARATHSAGADKLNAWLDGVLAQLDMRRETDLDAIEQLVHEGEIGKGHSARQEMADLWEEQRLKADELRTAWRFIEEHLDAGLDITVDGVEELEQLAERARDGLIGANPELTEHLDTAEAQQPEQIEDDDASTLDAARDESAVDATSSATEPMGLTRADASDAIDEPDEDATDEPDTDDPGIDEAGIDDVGDTETGGAPIPAESEEDDPDANPRHGQAELPVGESALRIDDAVSDTVPDAGGTGGLVPPDEPEQPELGSLESSSVNDYSEPDVDDAAVTHPGPIAKSNEAETLSRSSDEPADVAPGVTEPGRPGLEDDGAHDAVDAVDEHTTPTVPSASTPEEASSTDAPSPKPAPEPAPTSTATAPGAADATPDTPEGLVRGQCFRIRDGFQAVGWAEIVLALALPLTFAVAIGIIAALHITGQGGFNPFDRWGWTPAALVVALAWVVLVPVALRWRPKWVGWRPHVMRGDDVREERDIEVDDAGIRLGEHDWHWGQLRNPAMYRWDSPPDDMQGWLIEIETPRHGVIEFASPEPSRESWKRSTHELIDAPYEAWQVDRGLYQSLRSRIFGD